ncbi:UBP-type zinc finger domain-containing protein [Hymenobacter sp.]|uniref:UBP-type zinc finger domain-containing protein n=1 Tax=Hymenobacter sp. TaxID=1898978 RepID=UPI00286B4F88|nr:UBP-type zinc finger domain-containing protein [Hymenobacter sp.]
MRTSCLHLISLDTTQLKSAPYHVCPECAALGDSWVHLRVCQACGHVGCCNDSKNQHAAQHFRATHHPVIISAEPGERWAWCYPDQRFRKY